MKNSYFILETLFFVICLSVSNALSSGIEFDKNILERKQHLNFIENEVNSFVLENRNFSASAPCNDTNKCSNRGLCYNNRCVCQPGTSGPFCKTIDGCSDLECGDEKTAECAYDERNFKAYCKCKSWDHVYDNDAKQCRECKCDDCKSEYCLHAARRCEFDRGEKICACIEGYDFNPKTQICEFCSCGDDEAVKSCKFDDDGNKKCECNYGYKISETSCKKCDCGSGNCDFQGNKKICSCFSGYSEYNGFCRGCSCGNNAKCIFKEWYQDGCECNPGYTEVDGKCLEVCYCGNNGNCTLEYGKKICKCPAGFQDINGLCTDVNECDDPAICYSNMKCVNTIGSYYCICKKGFNTAAEDPETCEDINECLLSNPCTDSETECFNTIGSFTCVCKPGYATRMEAMSSVTCDSKSSWKLGFGFLIGISLAVIIGLMAFIYRRL